MVCPSSLRYLYGYALPVFKVGALRRSVGRVGLFAGLMQTLGPKFKTKSFIKTRSL